MNRDRRSIRVARSTKPSWLPICLNGCTKRFHVGRIPLRMPHRPHTLSKLLDKCRVRCGIRQMWHDVAERRQDEPVSRRGEDCFGDVFDSEVLLQPRVYGRKIVMRHGHQRPKSDRSIRSNEIGSRTDNKVESWQLRREYVSHRHPEVLHHCGIHDRAVKKCPNCGSRCCHQLLQLRNTVCLTSVLFRDSLVQRFVSIQLIDRGDEWRRSGANSGSTPDGVTLVAGVRGYSVCPRTVRQARFVECAAAGCHSSYPPIS